MQLQSPQVTDDTGCEAKCSRAYSLLLAATVAEAVQREFFAALSETALTECLVDAAIQCLIQPDLLDSVNWKQFIEQLASTNSGIPELTPLFTIYLPSLVVPKAPALCMIPPDPGSPWVTSRGVIFCPFPPDPSLLIEIARRMAWELNCCNFIGGQLLLTALLWAQRLQVLPSLIERAVLQAYRYLRYLAATFGDPQIVWECSLQDQLEPLAHALTQHDKKQ